MLKQKGGIKGITMNRNAVHRWILAQPDRCAITRQCEILAGISAEAQGSKNLSHSSMIRHEEMVQSVISTVESMINPFESDCDNLLSISSGCVASEQIEEDLLSAYSKGSQAASTYLKERLNETKIDIFFPISKLKLKTFKDLSCVKATKLTSQVTELKHDQALFARLLVVAQTRKINLKEILTYSLGVVSYPLANADGSMAKTNKAELLHAIEAKVECRMDTTVHSDAGALIVDAMAMLHGIVKVPLTFGQVAELVLKTLLQLAAQHSCTRVDFVCDTYRKASIKKAERSRRTKSGSQIVTIYSKDQSTPKQWKKFLAHDSNKATIVQFFAKVWGSTDLQHVCAIQLYTTYGGSCDLIELGRGTTTVRKVDALACDHEEADTRLFLHAAHASQSHDTIMIKSPDTDVAIIFIALSSKLKGNHIFLTGTKNKERLLDISKIASDMGPDVASALIGLHVFTGCDTTSAFYGKGKKRAFNLVYQNQAYIEAFCELGKRFVISSELLCVLEQFVAELYGWPETSNVNEVRYKAFCAPSVSNQSLPPTHDALMLHTTRANYQAAIHRRAMVQFIQSPDPVHHGWLKADDGELQIKWMLQKPAPDDVLQTIMCKCKASKCNSRRCSCRVFQLPCTDLCCCADCENTASESNEEELVPLDN